MMALPVELPGISHWLSVTYSKLPFHTTPLDSAKLSTTVSMLPGLPFFMLIRMRRDTYFLLFSYWFSV